jgi:hypothetical protein
MSGAQLVAWSQSTVRVQRGLEQECVVTLTASPVAPGCFGCRESDGRCRKGDEKDRCGTGGGACRKCEDDEQCKSGRCVE